MKRKILFLLTAVLGTVWFFGGGLEAAIPAEERSALIAFYNSTHGEGWTNNSGWKTPPLHTDGFAMPGTENEWYGITVQDDYVIEIFLMYNNLIGPIPPEIGNFSMLELLALMDNYTLSGSIPKEIGQLGNLILFQASVNNLSGPIPPEIGNLKKLKHLRLYANSLSGEIPPEMGNLTNLEDLMMGGNKLTGGIPASFGQLTNLGSLDFGGNRLDGSLPEELGNLTNIGYLELSSNALKGKIPSTLVNLQATDIRLRYNALYTNDNTLKAFLYEKEPGWETSQTIAPSDVTVTFSSPNEIEVSWEPIVYSQDAGGYLVYYRAQGESSWTYAGITADKTVSSFPIGDLEEGKFYCVQVKTRTFPHSQNENTVDSVLSRRACTGVGGMKPFGCFDTPMEGATVMSSIPVTGWALDDVGVVGVKIYREASAEYGEQINGNMIFIGDADFVEGARPDVEAAYPGFPDNTQAGWGYMLLTNCFPNGGNGTFYLHAIASDGEGNSTNLGVKRIICHNQDAVKPFGAIDTPSQGGDVSGTQFVNFGWALTPLPNTIPIDGTTIDVWVDGVPLGHPVYNRYRADIASIFPGYNNSTGAVGYFYLDTTAYTDGGHTIEWSVRDNAGNSDGIGSRYFNIKNPDEHNSTAYNTQNRDISKPLIGELEAGYSHIPVIDSKPIMFKEGYSRGRNDREGARLIYPDDERIINLEIKEAQRVVVWLDDGPDERVNQWIGYEVASEGKYLKRLPIGSTLDVEKGIFYWQPCAGFLGRYRLIFIQEEEGNLKKRINLTISITSQALNAASGV